MALTARQKRDARDAELREEGRRQAVAEMEAKGQKPPEALHPDQAKQQSDQIQRLNAQQFQDPGSSPAAANIATPQRSGATVTVGCKLGIAYYDIQLSNMVLKFQQDPRGGRDVKEAERIGPVVRLRGTAYPRGTPPKGFPAAPEIVNGAALTRGVDKDWFDQWLKQHERDPMVINHIIFAAETDDAARGMSRDFATITSGIDPVDPDNKKDPRVTKSSRGEVSDIERGVR